MRTGDRSVMTACSGLRISWVVGPRRPDGITMPRDLIYVELVRRLEAAVGFFYHVVIRMECMGPIGPIQDAYSSLTCSYCLGDAVRHLLVGHIRAVN